MSTKKRIVYPISMDPELDQKIKLAADRLDMSKSDVMKLAMKIGLEDFRRINYDLAKHLCQTPEPVSHLQSVAEEPNGDAPPARKSVRYPRGK